MLLLVVPFMCKEEVKQLYHRLDILTRCLTNEQNLCPRFLRCSRQLASAFVRLLASACVRFARVTRAGKCRSRQICPRHKSWQVQASVARVRFARVTNAGKCRSCQICYLAISRVQYVISRNSRTQKS